MTCAPSTTLAAGGAGTVVEVDAVVVGPGGGGTTRFSVVATGAVVGAGAAGVVTGAGAPTPSAPQRAEGMSPGWRALYALCVSSRIGQHSWTRLTWDKGIRQPARTRPPCPRDTPSP